MREALDDSGDRAAALLHVVRRTSAEAAAVRRALDAYQRAINQG